MKPYKHAKISAHRFGGKPEDYMEIHEWFDHSKAVVPDMRHRMVLHNAFGIYVCQQVFGHTFVNSDGRVVSVRDVGEQHVMDDLGVIPSLERCLRGMDLEQWMGGPVVKNLKKETVYVD